MCVRDDGSDMKEMIKQLFLFSFFIFFFFLHYRLSNAKRQTLSPPPILILQQNLAKGAARYIHELN